MKFHLLHTKSGWHWYIRAANGRILASSEVHTRRVGAMRAMKALADAGLKLEVVDHTRPR